MNTMTSLFVEGIMSSSELDDRMVIDLQLEQKQKYIEKLRKFYDEIDNDGSGEISYHELCANLHNPTWYAFAASLEIDASDAKQFFHLLSNEGNHPVDIDTFVVGCIKLKGHAKSMDLVSLAYAHQREMQTTRGHFEEVFRRLDGLQQNYNHPACFGGSSRDMVYQ